MNITRLIWGLCLSGIVATVILLSASLSVEHQDLSDLGTELRLAQPQPDYSETGSAVQEPFFIGLGDLAGGHFRSSAHGVSADGSVVVGDSHSHLGLEAFRWTPSEGMVGLGFPQASAVSSNGSVVVGYRLLAGEAEPLRWTKRGSIEVLKKFAGHKIADAQGVSKDGSVIVGTCCLRSGEDHEAFRWTKGGGMTRLGFLSGQDLPDEAHAVSADGAVIIGEMWNESGRCEAFRWTRRTGMVGLGFLSGDAGSTAYAVSADGSVVVGSSGKEAFRWTEQDGMVGLGTLPNGRRRSIAFGISADGSVVVGLSKGKYGLQAFIWDCDCGIRSLHDALKNDFGLGSQLAGWKLRRASAVSADGQVIVGSGVNPHGETEAWIARLRTGTRRPAQSDPLASDAQDTTYRLSQDSKPGR